MVGPLSYAMRIRLSAPLPVQQADSPSFPRRRARAGLPAGTTAPSAATLVCADNTRVQLRFVDGAEEAVNVGSRQQGFWSVLVQARHLPVALHPDIHIAVRGVWLSLLFHGARHATRWLPG